MHSQACAINMMDGRMSALILIPLNNVSEIYAGWEESLSSATPLDLKPRGCLV